MLKKWINKSREAYNFTLEKLQTDKDVPKSKLKLKNLLVKKFNKDTPNTVIEYAIFQALLAYKASYKTSKKRSCNNLTQSICVDGRSVKNDYIYPRNSKKYFKENDIDHRKQVIKNLPKSNKILTITYKKYSNKFYIIEPVEVERTRTKKRHFISLDPGVRSFVTFYSSIGVGSAGEDLNKKLIRLFESQDKLNAKINEEKEFKRKSKLKRACAKIRGKIKNLVDDFHWKLCKFLTKFKTIILPDFTTKKMAGTLPSKVSRIILSQSHYRFKQRLIQKSYERRNNVIICNESYTSKTCTRCGEQNDKLGASKKFKCEKCKLCIDRDENGARNILLRTCKQ